MLLIDPPVSRLSEPKAIEAWIGRLLEMEERHPGSKEVDQAISEAQKWLDWRESKEQKSWRDVRDERICFHVARMVLWWRGRRSPEYSPKRK